MAQRGRILPVVLVLILLLAGCDLLTPGSGEALPAAERPTEVLPTAKPLPTPTPEALHAATATALPMGALAAAPTHAAAPAPPDDYRFDSADVVGATGRLQLVEFLTTW